MMSSTLSEVPTGTVDLMTITVPGRTAWASSRAAASTKLRSA